MSFPPQLRTVLVKFNGQRVTGFTMENTNPNTPVSVTPDGYIALENSVGESWLTVTYGESFALFK